MAGGVLTRCRREADPGRKPGRPSRAGEGAAAGPSRSFPGEDRGAVPGLTRRALPRRAAPSRVRGARRALPPGGSPDAGPRRAWALRDSGREGAAPALQPHARRRSGPRGRPASPAARCAVWSGGHTRTFSEASLPTRIPGHPTRWLLFLGRWQLRGGSSLGELQGRGYEEEITESVALRLASRDPPSSTPDVCGGH